MPTKLDENPNRSIYDDNNPGWYSQPNATANSPGGSTAALKSDDSNTPASGLYKPDELINKESGAMSPGGQSATGDSRSIGGGLKKFSGKISNLSPQKKILGGGSIGGIIGIVIAISSFSSLALIDLKENLLGRFNPTNFALEKRGSRSLSKAMRDMADDPRSRVARSINKEKFQRKFQRQGFIVDIDADGKLTRFGFPDADAPGGIRNLDLEGNDWRRAVDDFSEGKQGRKFARKLERTIPTRGSIWKGSVARKLWRSQGVRYTNWLDRKPADAAGSNKKFRFADLLRNKDAYDNAERARISSRNARPDAETNRTLGIDPDAEDFDAERVRSDDFSEGLDDDSQRIRGDPTRSAAEIANPDVGVRPGTLAKNMLSPGSVVRTVNIAGWYQSACRVKGTLNLIGEMRNILLAAQLAKFTINIMTAADHQKAGVLSSEGLQLLMGYMQTRNPDTGNSWNSSGGMRWLNGDRTARVNPENLADLTMSRDSGGTLSDVTRELNRVAGPALTEDGCRTANNIFVQAGGVVVGIGAIVASGGSVGAGQVAVSVGLAAAEELAFIIGKQMAIRSIEGIVMDGFEDGEFVGDAIAAGAGAMYGMNGSVNGVLPSTSVEFAQIEEEIRIAKLEYFAEKSAFERYASISNPHSMGRQIAVAAVNSPIANMDVKSVAHSFTKSAVNLSFMNSLLPFQRTVFAQSANDQCNDPAIQGYGVASDPFCNPMLVTVPLDHDTRAIEQNLLSGNQINPDGSPRDGSDYADYIERCHSGRAGILYSVANEDGSGGGEDPRCITPTNTQKEYSHFYGYWVDEQNFIEDVNDDYPDDSGLSSSSGASPGASIEGNPQDESVSIDCASGTEDLGIHLGYNRGSPAQYRLCAVSNLPSTASESTPGNQHYIEGAAGKAIVNSRVSGAVYAMVEAARADGVNLAASSTFRSNDHQTYLYNCYLTKSCNNGNLAAAPGNSNHQSGVAIDFSGMSTSLSGCRNSPSAFPSFVWLNNNASSYGYSATVESECWHWSPDGN
jgi:hypothetical protein